MCTAGACNSPMGCKMWDVAREGGRILMIVCAAQYTYRRKRERKVKIEKSDLACVHKAAAEGW